MPEWRFRLASRATFGLPVVKSTHGSLADACHSRASSSGTAGSIRGQYGHTDLLVYLGKDA